jgi:TrmH family RNA methyltransferase
MATQLGFHAERLKAVAALRTVRGRRASRRFTFEGTTLLAEANAAGTPPEELYVTQEAYDAAPLVRELERLGVPTFIVDPSSVARLSDVATPSGVVAVAPQRLWSPDKAFMGAALSVVLADVGDPANAGTILRSAEAFGCTTAIFGSLGVDPYHPKVVRGSMGAVFRLRLVVCEPPGLAAAAAACGVRVLGLAAEGTPLEGHEWSFPSALVTGHERRGLGRWRYLCEGLLGIPMRGRAESLSAAVAAAIALYQASHAMACQESVQGPKSQDYRR